jgi:hypothetical protein
MEKMSAFEQIKVQWFRNQDRVIDKSLNQRTIFMTLKISIRENNQNLWTLISNCIRAYTVQTGMKKQPKLA